VRPLLPPLALACVAVAAGCGGGGSAPAAAPDGAQATVRRVVDGDTLIARAGGADERVRLLGVDAPESVTPDRPVECFGPQAGAHLRALLPRGTRVVLVADPTQGARDRYGRMLAEVRRPGDPASVNEAMVAGGYAEVFRGDGRGALQPALRTAEREARAAGRGLWGACRRGG
jgi:micrococcal nuclease